MSVTEPVRFPAAVGVNITLIVQVAPAARLEPQVFVWAKSPVTAILVNVSAAVLPLVSVTVCAAEVVPLNWSGKLKLVEERLTAGAEVMPVKPTMCGLPAALSVMMMDPVRLPVAVGVKLTLMTHAPPATTLVPQVFVCAKSPVTTMLVKDKVESPVSLSSTDLTSDVEPSG